MRAAALACLLLASACAPAPDVRVMPDKDLRGYRHFAVLPFADDHGLGSTYARELSKSLFLRLDLAVVDQEQVDVAFKQLGMRAGGTTGMHDLIEIRTLTHSDAAVKGIVDCRPGSEKVSVMVLDTLDGEVAFQASFVPGRCGKSRDVRPVVDKIVALLRRAMGPSRGTPGAFR